MWGQVSPTLTLEVSFRIIPTRVGTSLWCNPCTSRLQDHPHACGDKNPSTGKFIVSDRIIPTRVGTSYKYMRRISIKKDHPHACGDKEISFIFLICTVGSSPRVWGQGRQLPFITINGNIIPTRMGTRNNISIVKLAD